MRSSKKVVKPYTLACRSFCLTTVFLGLRIYSAAPSPLERVVPVASPKSGVDVEGFDLMGFELPPGTVVATQAWSIHRNPAIFPDPDTFSPERWLETDQPGSTKRLTLMQQNMMPFGTGSRMCGGQNLAQMMLKIILASMARNFDIVAPSETNEKSMEIKDSFVGYRFLLLLSLNFCL